MREREKARERERERAREHLTASHCGAGKELKEMMRERRTIPEEEALRMYLQVSLSLSLLYRS